MNIIFQKLPYEKQNINLQYHEVKKEYDNWYFKYFNYEKLITVSSFEAMENNVNHEKTFPYIPLGLPTKTIHNYLDKRETLYTNELRFYSNLIVDNDPQYDLESYFMQWQIDECLRVAYSKVTWYYNYSKDEVLNMISAGELIAHDSGLILDSNIYNAPLPRDYSIFNALSVLKDVSMTYQLNTDFRIRYEKYKSDLYQYQLKNKFNYLVNNYNIDITKFKYYIKINYYPSVDTSRQYQEGEIPIINGYFENGYNIFIKFDDIFQYLGYFTKENLNPLFYQRVISYLNLTGISIDTSNPYESPFRIQFYEGVPETIENPNDILRPYYKFYNGDSNEIKYTPEGFFFFVGVNHNPENYGRLYFLSTDKISTNHTPRPELIQEIVGYVPTIEQEQEKKCCLAECFGITE